MEKTGNGAMKRSEESITPMTSYRFSHHDSGFFAGAQDDVLPSLVILNGRKNAL